jgi:hypothetical protein
MATSSNHAEFATFLTVAGQLQQIDLPGFLNRAHLAIPSFQEPINAAPA